MHPEIIVQWPAVGAAVAAAFLFGGLWYGPLCGAAWAKAMGFAADFKPTSGQMRRAFSLQIVGTFLTVWVLAHTNEIWRASTWGFVGKDLPHYQYGFFGGFFTWLGFYVPLQLGKISWEMRQWRIFFINAGHDFFHLQIISQILAHWR